jgi:Fe2+ transport system protein FeoA
MHANHSDDVKTGTVPLTALTPRQCGVVAMVEAPDGDLERLMAMGVCGGRTVELVQLGDPLILKIYGTRIGVSARLARRILVVPCGEPCCLVDPGECPLSPEVAS